MLVPLAELLDRQRDYWLFINSAKKCVYSVLGWRILSFLEDHLDCLEFRSVKSGYDLYVSYALVQGSKQFGGLAQGWVGYGDNPVYCPF